MTKINKKLIVLLVLLVSTIAKMNHIYAENLSDLKCTSAVVVENDTGKVLYGKDENKQAYPASTTKIMTALLALEKLDLEKSITVPQDFPPVDGSSMYLLPGETFKVKELLQALLVHSCNDVAVLFAREISGSVDKFVNLMNTRAQELGAKNTHFANPHGLHDANHYTTAYDMSLIAREAMKNEFFRNTVALPNLILEATPQTKEKRIYFNTNRFLWSKSQIIYKNKYIPIKYDIIDGVKTGYTLEAGNCLVSSGVKNGMRLISVVFKSEGFEMYRDSRILLDYGFDNFKIENIVKANELIGSEKIKFSVQKKMDYTTTQNVSNIIKMGDSQNYEKTIKLDDIKLPIKKGDKVGSMSIKTSEGEQTYDVVSLNDVDSIFTINYIKKIILEDRNIIIKIGLSMLAIVVILSLIFAILGNSRRRRRRRRRRYRR